MLLAIDTSTRAGSVALLAAGGTVVSRALADQDQGAALAPTVAALLGDGGLARVDGYALSIGPGSFTGLRIGLAFLKGLAVVHPRPAVAVSTLELLAAGLADAYPEAELFLPLLDARREEVFAGLYRRGPGGVSPDPRLVDGLYPCASVLATLRDRSASDLIACGDGAALPALAGAGWGVSERSRWAPDAAVLARLAWPRLASGAGEDPLAVELAYFQLSAAEEKLARASAPAP
jgi:tRNA threonylcarbamoyladenosine biosynthesis protein TsaB